MDAYEKNELDALFFRLESIQDEKLSSEEFSDLLNLFDLHLRRYLATEALRLQQAESPEQLQVCRAQHDRIRDELASLHVFIFENRGLRVRDVLSCLAAWLQRATGRAIPH